MQDFGEEIIQIQNKEEDKEEEEEEEEKKTSVLIKQLYKNQRLEIYKYLDTNE